MKKGTAGSTRVIAIVAAACLLAAAIATVITLFVSHNSREFAVLNTAQAISFVAGLVALVVYFGMRFGAGGGAPKTGSGFIQILATPKHLWHVFFPKNLK